MKNKIEYFIYILAYHISVDSFCNNNTSKNNQSLNGNVISDVTSKKSLKIDKMKVLENDENFQPNKLNNSNTNENKKNALHR